MAELGELLGTILASVAHARRMADEETAALAEYYKDHPLLEGMAPSQSTSACAMLSP